MRAVIGRYAVLAAAAAAWIAAILAVVTDDVPTPYHGLLDIAAIILSTWALLHHYCGEPRLKPGQRVVDSEEYFRIHQALTSGLAEARDKKDAKGAQVRQLHSA